MGIMPFPMNVVIYIILIQKLANAKFAIVNNQPKFDTQYLLIMN